MVSIRQKHLEELKRLTQEVVDNDTQNEKNISALAKTIAEYLLRTETKFSDALSAMQNVLTKGLSDVKKEVTDATNQMKQECRDTTAQMVSKVDAKLSEVKDGYSPEKGVDYDDGEDADPEAVAEMVIAKLFPKVVTKEDFQTLQDLLEKLLDMEEEIKKLKARPASVSVLPSAPSGRSIFKEVDISDSLDGVTKTFSIGAFYRVLTIDLSSFPNTLRKTVDYTYDGNAGTVTFTSQIDAASTLAAGQTCIINLILA